MWTLCSIGSNIEPELNTRTVLRALMREFGTVYVSPLIRTEPVGMNSRQYFLNGLVRFQSNLNSADLKAWLVNQEIEQGRDRDAANSKTADRPLDVDILDRQLSYLALEPRESSPYVDAMWRADQHQFGGLTLCCLSFEGVLLGQKTTAIDFDDRTGHVGVVAQGPQGVDQRLETALAAQ